MKSIPVVSRACRVGFTLVELLVVMAIIAILAAAVLTTGNAVINQAKRAKAANMCTQIQTATLGFYTEYSVYPSATTTAPTSDTLVSTAAQWGVITEILCGGFDPNAPTVAITVAPGNANTRQIAFLTLNKADIDTTVTPSAPKLPFKNAANATLYPVMSIDYDYSNVLGDNAGTAAAPPDFAGALNGLSSTAVSSGNISTTKAIAGGIAVWGCCDPNTTATLTNPKLWVKTF